MKVDRETVSPMIGDGKRIEHRANQETIGACKAVCATSGGGMKCRESQI